MRILVVAAWEPELARLRELVGAGGELVGAGLALEPIGVGPVEAAIGVTTCIARHAPDRAVLIGTCGAFAGRGLAVLDVVAAPRVHLAAPAVIEGCADLPPPMPAEQALDSALHDALVEAGARSATVASTVGVTTDDALAARLATRGDVEHLEAFAFARACASAGVPASVALAVANPVGREGREAWRAHHVEASARAAELVARVLLRTSTRAPSPARA